MSLLLVSFDNYILYIILAGLGISIIATLVRSFTREIPFKIDSNFVSWSFISIISFVMVQQILRYFQITTGFAYFVSMGLGIYLISQIVVRLTKYFQKLPRKDKKAVKGLIVGLLCISGLIILIQSNLVLNIFQDIIQTPLGQRQPETSGINSKSMGRYDVGNVITDTIGKEGMAIVGNNFAGQYSIKRVYLDYSGKGWHTNGPQYPQSLTYDEVELQFPVIWQGGMIDPTHIAEKDWSLPENWKSQRIFDQNLIPADTNPSSVPISITSSPTPVPSSEISPPPSFYSFPTMETTPPQQFLR